MTHEIGWRAWASQNLNAEKSSIPPCLKEERFDDSIFNIMAKGISDCACERGVFSDQNLKVAYNGKTKLIVVDCNADPKSFEQGEWNVILLFNYLWSAMHASPGKFNIYDFNKVNEMVYDARQRLTKVKDNLIAVYKGKRVADSKLTEYLDRAYIEIDTYAFSLGLYAYLHEYQRNKQSGKSLFSPNTIGWKNYDPSTKNGSFRLNSAVVELEGQKTPIHLDVIVEDGNIEQYKLWDTTGYYYPNRNLIGKFKTFKENFKLDNGFIEEQFKDKLLKRTQIHNLCNYYNKKLNTNPIVQDKCYLNSCLQAFHASATIRENVKRLNKKQGINRTPNFGPNNKLNMRDISPVLTSIFNAIENGGMERYVKCADTQQNLKTYQDAISNLADCLEHSEAWRCAWTSLYGQNISNQLLLSRYKEVYNNPTFYLDAEENQDYKSARHMIRQAGSNKANMIATEITQALATEAYDKQEEQIAPVEYEIMINNAPNNIRRFNKLLIDTHIIESSVIKQDFPDALPKESTLASRPTHNDKIPGMILPTVAPVIIQPITYQTKDGGELQIIPQKVYKEITQSVNGKKHKYRLVAQVQFPHTGGHYRTTILSQDGWVKIDDIDKTDIAVKLPSDYDENSGQAWDDNRSVAIYEPLY